MKDAKNLIRLLKAFRPNYHLNSKLSCWPWWAKRLQWQGRSSSSKHSSEFWTKNYSSNQRAN